MKKIRMLLVDDEKDFLTACSRRLVRRNVEVSVASSGEEALEKIVANTYDVVLLDVMMPDMNGIETLRRIKAIAPHLPVIILSGHAGSKAVGDGMSSGAFDYLLKPVGADELYFKALDAIRAGRLATA